MQLFHSPASPYVRKVMVIAHLTGQTIDTVPASLSPVSRNMDVVAQNPLGKVPTAMTDDGPLYDSRVICQYLDAQHSGAPLYPASGPKRWTALRREALADGMLDAALLARYEGFLRPEDKRWPEWQQGQMDKVASSLDALEVEAGGFEGIDAGMIAVGCALGYLDFRFAAMDWRAGRPVLAAWFEVFAQTPAMQETAPPAA
ncbi:MAG: glutathione S-transferase [Paracoccaceae bacterium]|jgi:glutathione S-transferase